MSKKKWFIVLLVVVLVFSLVACTPNTPNKKLNNQGTEKNNTTNKTNQIKQNKPNNTNADTNAIVSYEEIKVKPQEAYNIFVKKYPDAKVNELELDFEDGTYVYQVEGYQDTTEYELNINPVNGKILKEKQEQKVKDLRDGEITLENIDKIQELIDQTLKDAGIDFKIEEWSLKSEKDQAIFNIEVINENKKDLEYKYDVSTGKLIEKD